MAQQTNGSSHRIMDRLERALDNNSEYIGEKVWGELNDAYNQVDSDVSDLQDELDEANERIKELESHIEELEV